MPNISSYHRYKCSYRDIVSFLSYRGDIIVCTCCAILLDATVNQCMGRVKDGAHTATKDIFRWSRGGLGTMTGLCMCPQLLTKNFAQCKMMHSHNILSFAKSIEN